MTATGWPYAVAMLVMWWSFLPFVARVVAVIERKYGPPTAATPDAPMPMGLIQMAKSQGAEWAAEDMIAAMRESYAECHDWSVVASLFADAGRDVTSQRMVY